MRYGYFDAQITGYDENTMPIFDRAEDSEFFCKLFSIFVRDGIYATPSTNLQVVATTGMTVSVSAGTGMIKGHMAWAETAESLTLDDATTLNRIDRIVLRLDYLNREIVAAVVKGTPASSPEAPALTRDSDAYELALADVYVGASVTSISQANITDQRQDEDLCGVIAGLIDQIETASLFAQFTDAWNTWFDAIEGQLSEDAATNLYNAKYDKPIRFTDTAVAAEAWVTDTTYSDYGYKADITLSGVTADMVPDIVLPLAVAISGDVAPVAICGAGYVRIYASTAQAAMTIPTITCWKAV